jgi:hypothetical protein
MPSFRQVAAATARADRCLAAWSCSTDVKLQHDIEAFWQAARPVLRRFAENPNDLEPIRAYFNEVYWQRGAAALDAARVAGRAGILQAIKERATGLTFPFASIADAFEMIEDYKEPVIVPWRAHKDVLFGSSRNLCLCCGAAISPQSEAAYDPKRTSGEQYF